MAKVDTIKLNVDGVDYSYNVNVGKEGIFRCSIDWSVATKLKIDSPIESKNLDEVRSTIWNAHREYVDASKEETLYIENTLLSGNILSITEGEDKSTQDD